MNRDLNELEQDLIEFLAMRKQVPVGEIEASFRYLRKQLGCFKSSTFKDIGSNLQRIYGFFHDTQSRESVLSAYRYLAPIHILVFLSYSYPKTFRQRWHDAWKMFTNKQYAQLLRFGKRYVKETVFKKGTPRQLLSYSSDPTPVIVDYGCGMAHLSSAMVRQNPEAKVYLVDINSLILEFTEYRFRKYKYNFEVITITKDNLYPSLPAHTICLANEVMEHVFEPLTVYDNIHASLASGGLLWGNFADHEKGLLHVSPDLSALRKKIGMHFDMIDTKLYKKIR